MPTQRKLAIATNVAEALSVSIPDDPEFTTGTPGADTSRELETIELTKVVFEASIFGAVVVCEYGILSSVGCLEELENSRACERPEDW